MTATRKAKQNRRTTTRPSETVRLGQRVAESHSLPVTSMNLSWRPRANSLTSRGQCSRPLTITMHSRMKISSAPFTPPCNSFGSIAHIHEINKGLWVELPFFRVDASADLLSDRSHHCVVLSTAPRGTLKGSTRICSSNLVVFFFATKSHHRSPW